MENEVYMLDNIIQEFLESYTSKEKIKLYYGVIRNIDMLNDLPNIYVEYDLNELESKIIDVIEEQDTEENKAVTIHEMIKTAGIEHIKSLGIELIEDRSSIYFYQIVNILFGLYNMFNTNIKGAEFILDTLRNENNEDDVNISQLLEEYTSVPAIEYFELIADVDETLLTTLTKYFRDIMENYDPALDDETNNGIKSLLEIDPLFNNTDVVKDMLRLGLKPNLLSNNLNNLYFNIHKYVTNIEFIPYEIAATLFLCDDSEQNMVEYFNEDINLDLVDFIEKDQVLKDTIYKSTLDLINKLQCKVVRR